MGGKHKIANAFRKQMGENKIRANKDQAIKIR